MREIKFRAWDNESSGWMPDVDELALEFLTGSNIELEQFIGLKDDDGKEIYAGDILLCGDGGESFPDAYDAEKDEYYPTGKYAVAWIDDCFGFDIVGYPDIEMHGLGYLTSYSPASIKIVGNIHENPDLLK